MSTTQLNLGHRPDPSQNEHKGEVLNDNNNNNSHRSESRANRSETRFQLGMPETTPFKNTGKWIYDVCLARATEKNYKNFVRTEFKNLFSDYRITAKNFVDDCDNALDVSSVISAVGKLAANMFVVSPVASLARLAKMAIKGFCHLLKNLIMLIGFGIMMTAYWCKNNPKKALVAALLITAAVLVGVYFVPLSILATAFVKTAGVVGASLCGYLLVREIFNLYSYRKRNQREDLLLQQITLLSEAMKAKGIAIPEKVVKIDGQIKNDVNEVQNNNNNNQNNAQNDNNDDQENENDNIAL